VREVPGAATHRPETLIGFSPDVREVVEHRALERPVLIARVEPAAGSLVQRIHHLAENVELQLPVRRDERTDHDLGPFAC
jgi:hypothetical protein